MKKLIFLICAIMAGLAGNAQAVIGKTTPDGSGIVDFAANGKSGIVLPWVTTLPTGNALTGGVMLYDATLKKVMYYDGTSWVDLSKHVGTVDLSMQSSVPEAATKGTIVGAQTSTADGVLVLEATDKALILPKVASPQTNIIKPMAGTICWDTTKKLVCIYNGTEWTFWK